MRYFNYDVTLADVPGEISLALSISGCQLKCKACFWQTIKSSQTHELTDEEFIKIIKPYLGYISCVLFYGGEWCPNELINKLIICQQYKLNTCLYTGQTKISQEISQYLTFLKTGSYSEKKGPLTKPTTNQKLVNLLTGENLTPKFWHLLPQK